MYFLGNQIKINVKRKLVAHFAVELGCLNLFLAQCRRLKTRGCEALGELLNLSVLQLPGL